MCAVGVALAALLLRTHKGGHDSGRSIWSNSPLPELPPSALAGDRATRRQGKKGPVQVCGPELPPSRKTGGVQATSRRRTQNQAAAKASNGTVMHARTPTPGRSRDVRATRRRARLSKSSTIAGGREMRLMRGSSPVGGTSTGHGSVEVMSRQTPRM